MLFNASQEFPPTSKLDASVYGDQTSKITKKNLQINLGKVTVEKVNDIY